MKCRKCEIELPNWLKIEGKYRNISNRKYCLTCSPWGLHRTRPIVENLPASPRCDKCGRLYEYDPSKGHSRSRCNSCISNQNRLGNRLTLIAENGGKCVRCGYSKCLKALEFHHRNSAEKKFLVAGTRSLRALREEAKKCDLLCANCHREVHEEISISSRSSRNVERSLDKRDVAGATPAETTILYVRDEASSEPPKLVTRERYLPDVPLYVSNINRNQCVCNRLGAKDRKAGLR